MDNRLIVPIGVLIAAVLIIAGGYMIFINQEGGEEGSHPRQRQAGNTENYQTGMPVIFGRSSSGLRPCGASAGFGIWQQVRHGRIVLCRVVWTNVHLCPTLAP